MLRAESGTYVLVLHCSMARAIRVGRLGALRLRPGYYYRGRLIRCLSVTAR